MGQFDHVEYDASFVKKIYADSYASFQALPGFPFERKFLQYRFKKVLSWAGVNLSGRKSFLDLGCGMGLKTRILADFFEQSEGLDFVDRCIVIANLLNDKPGLEFVQGDATQPNGKKYDVVTAFGLSLYNVHDWDKCAAGIQSSTELFCAKGGLMVVYSFTDFSGKAPTGWVNHTRSDLKQILDHLNKHGLKSKIVFPHRHWSNYVGNGGRHLLGEVVKLFSRKRRDYYIVIQIP